MKVEIWSDVACPWCYVGKRRFEAALAQFEHRDQLDIVWRSFELDPAAPRRHDTPATELLARKYRVPVAQAEAMNARLTSEARREGLDLDLAGIIVGNTFDAHRLIHLAAELGLRQAMVERLFKAYFTDNEAIGEHDVLVRLAGEVGIPTDRARRMLESDEFAAAVRADQVRARGFGITGVPFFAIDERYGISGAQPADALLGALRQAWEESRTQQLTVVGNPTADGCTDDGCAM
jgi:predicted DsbA family dithiol-disulfide isomerase